MSVRLGFSSGRFPTVKSLTRSVRCLLLGVFIVDGVVNKAEHGSRLFARRMGKISHTALSVSNLPSKSSHQMKSPESKFPGPGPTMPGMFSGASSASPGLGIVPILTQGTAAVPSVAHGSVVVNSNSFSSNPDGLGHTIQFPGISGSLIGTGQSIHNSGMVTDIRSNSTFEPPMFPSIVRTVSGTVLPSPRRQMLVETVPPSAMTSPMRSSSGSGGPSTGPPPVPPAATGASSSGPLQINPTGELKRKSDPSVPSSLRLRRTLTHVPICVDIPTKGELALGETPSSKLSPTKKQKRFAQKKPWGNEKSCHGNSKPCRQANSQRHSRSVTKLHLKTKTGRHQPFHSKNAVLRFTQASDQKVQDDEDWTGQDDLGEDGEDNEDMDLPLSPLSRFSGAGSLPFGRQEDPPLSDVTILPPEPEYLRTKSVETTASWSDHNTGLCSSLSNGFQGESSKDLQNVLEGKRSDLSVENFPGKGSIVFGGIFNDQVERGSDDARHPTQPPFGAWVQDEQYRSEEFQHQYTYGGGVFNLGIQNTGAHPDWRLEMPAPSRDPTIQLLLPTVPAADAPGVYADAHASVARNVSTLLN